MPAAPREPRPLGAAALVAAAPAGAIGLRGAAASCAPLASALAAPGAARPLPGVTARAGEAAAGWAPPASAGAPRGRAAAAGAAALAAVALRAVPDRLRGGARRRRGRVGARAFESELGVQAPLGYWDPLGLASDGDFEEFYRRREAELKNGRVAMYATIGYIVPEYFRLPGFLSPSADLTFQKVPNGIDAVKVVPLEGWLQIIAWCGFFELCVNVPQHPMEPGNYYKGRFGVFWNRIIGDKKKRERALNVELANGRLAMMAILGMLFQNGVTGTTGPEMWMPAAAPAMDAVA